MNFGCRLQKLNSASVEVKIEVEAELGKNNNYNNNFITKEPQNCWVVSWYLIIQITIKQTFFCQALPSPSPAGAQWP